MTKTRRAALDKLAQMPRITGYGIRSEVTRRESDEPVIVEYDEAHQTDVYLVASPFAHLYYQVAKVDSEWRCTAADEATKIQCIRKALAFKNGPALSRVIARRRVADMIAWSAGAQAIFMIEQLGMEPREADRLAAQWRDEALSGASC